MKEKCRMEGGAFDSSEAGGLVGVGWRRDGGARQILSTVDSFYLPK